MLASFVHRSGGKSLLMMGGYLLHSNKIKQYWRAGLECEELSFGLIIIFVSKISAAMQEFQTEVPTTRKQHSFISKISQITNSKQKSKFQAVNIRESAYKIFRSNSKRSEHSLSAKKPIRVQQKLKEMQQSSNNLQKGYNKKDLKKKKIDWKEKSVMLIYHEQNNLLSDSNFTKNLIQQSSMVNQSSSKRESEKHSREEQEIILLRNIWQNLKQLKEKSKFIVEIIEMEMIMHKMLAKLADGSHKSSRIIETQQKMHNFLTATCQTQMNTIKLDNIPSDRKDSLQKYYNEQQQPKRLMYIVDEQKKESYSSMSLKIENEQNHSREFLQSYHEDICQNPLSDITYFDQMRNSLENFESYKWNSYNDNNSQSPSESQRVILKTIIKKNKTNPRNQQCIVATCDQVGTICRGTKFQQDSEPYCELFDCEKLQGSKQNILSSDGSQSKRSALNQIILMLNEKYHKNLKQVSPKLHQR